MTVMTEHQNKTTAPGHPQHASELTFRQATLSDAPFIALIMMEAVGVPLMEQGKLPEDGITDICRREDTLYSYRNAVIAEIDGKPVGGLISYNGKGYHDIKVHTFSLVRENLPFNPDDMDDETREGEYYLDSAAILPEYRGKGYGRQVIKYGIGLARKLNLLPILACDPENRNAYGLYSSLGFKDSGRFFIFGEDYIRMSFPESDEFNPDSVK